MSETIFNEEKNNEQINVPLPLLEVKNFKDDPLYIVAMDTLKATRLAIWVTAVIGILSLIFIVATYYNTDQIKATDTVGRKVDTTKLTVKNGIDTTNGNLTKEIHQLNNVLFLLSGQLVTQKGIDKGTQQQIFLSRVAMQALNKIELLKRKSENSRLITIYDDLTLTPVSNNTDSTSIGYLNAIKALYDECLLNPILAENDSLYIAVSKIIKRDIKLCFLMNASAATSIYYNKDENGKMHQITSDEEMNEKKRVDLFNFIQDEIQLNIAIANYAYLVLFQIQGELSSLN